MTQSQKELWMAAEQSPEASCAFNLGASVFLNGDLDTQVLQQALNALLQRHESLRGSFSANSVSMCIADTLDLPIEHLDLTENSDEQQQATLESIKLEEANTAFDLTFGPLLRARLAILGPNRAILFLTFHHLIVDGWTLDLLLKELGELYSAYIEERQPDLPPAYQFSDYSRWIEDAYASPEAADAEDYWLQEFASKAPTLELPVDYPRPTVRSFAAARVEHPLEGDDAQKIFASAAEQKSTFFIFAFAAYVAFIHRITGQEDIVVAVPAAGHLDVGENQLSGHCVNTLPIRCEVDGKMSFGELLKTVRKKVYAGYGNTPFTYSRLMGRVPMDRDAARPPLASLIMTVDQESHQLPFSGMESRYSLNPRAFEMFELQVSLVTESKDRIEVQCQYNTDLFAPATAEGRMRDFATLLRSAAEQPDSAVSELAILSPADKLRTDQWNATACDYPTDATMHGLFERQVDEAPDNVALEFDGQTLTYGELERRSNKLAAWLTEQGIGPEEMVGICMERSLEMIIAMYGILKAGGAYVPFDPEYPEDRLSFILQDTEAKVLLTHELSKSAVAELEATVLCLDSEWATLENYSDARTPAAVDGSTLAYTIFTSGSTGQPKGAMNEHRNICNQLFWMQQTFKSDSSDAILLKTPYSFDVSLWEIFYPLSTGARVVIAPPGAHRDPEQLADLFRDCKITGTCFVPSLLSVYVHSAHAAPESLRWIISIGEALTTETEQCFHQKMTGVELHNLYGPAEAAVAVTHWLCDPDSELHHVPIGLPTANVSIYMLDENLQQVPIGVPGELVIGGVQVGRGYLNRDESTAKVFVEDPFSDEPDAMMYRTGDRARWTHQGVIEYLGRIDFQVKLHGLRIELGEIENVLAEHKAIENAVVNVDEPRPGEKRLVAYYTGDTDPGAAQLRAYLGERLPHYMIPHLYVPLDDFPILPSGKVDRKDLPKPVLEVLTKPAELSRPTNDIEQTVAALWADYLQISDVDVDETFFNQGGSSLLALKLVGKLAEVFDTRVPVAKFFEFPTVSSFSNWVAETGAASATPNERAPGPLAKPDHDEAKQSIASSDTLAGSDIAIVGMAGKFPQAENIDEFWRNLLEVKDCITHFAEDEIDPDIDPEIRSQPNYIRARGLMPDIDAFDAKFFGVPPRDAQVMDPQQRVFMETCWHALEDAAYDVGNFGGRIGIFAGTGDNTYLWNYVLKDQDTIDAIGEHQTHILNERDFLTTRIAYKLDLRGPALSIATACSTSLVATCYAVDSLRAGKCDAAIAGGIYIPTPDHSGYLYQEGGVGSIDGTCRPFDVDATGAVFSSGTAAVVLRRLEDAEADGDRIYAVIRGVATNNDGADKMSFTAPSATGQRRVVEDAVANAGVDAADIGYIEAHGTATEIGDLIEFSALQAALGHGNGGARWLGSVKSNIGALDAAAGVTGLIKTAKALHTGTIPGTAHFKEANPELDIESSGFSVTSQNVHWRESRKSMLAGVNCFGVGGTNAHVVLQSYDVVPSPALPRDQELFLLSADTPQQLTSLASNLADHIDTCGTEIVSDAAFTMARGRKRLATRAAAAFAAEDAPQALRELAEQAIFHTPLNNPAIAFMFPGQGSQHLGMGCGLYRQSAVFRDLFDQGAETLRPTLKTDLKELLFDSAADNDIAQKMLVKTGIAESALYVLEYALARHWMDWGIEPSAVFGHSVGEYAAATVAGIMSFETGLELVAARGQLIEKQPEGAMLSVRAAPNVIDRYLNEAVELAAVNSPELCVVSGPTDAISTLTRGLEADNIAASSLHTTHAFHSAMMEPARQKYRRVVAQHPLSTPERKIISTMTGKVMSAEEAVNPDYWASHLRFGVRFSDAVRTCWSGSNPILLEIGPRQTATTLAKQHIENRKKQRAIASLDGNSTPDKEWQSVLRAAGELWASGVELDWAAIYNAAERKVVSLPAYPFRRSRYWIGRPVDELLDDQDAAETEVIDDTIVAKISEIIEKGSGFRILPADIHRNLLDIGLDSLYLTRLAMQIQKEFGVAVGLREIIESHSSISELADFLRGEPSQQTSQTAANEDVAAVQHVDAFRFGRDNRLMGFYHAAVGKPKKHGVLIASPLLNEYMRSHAVLRQVATQLAENGYDVLRFDYEGMGNSDGSLEEVSIGRWMENLTESVNELVTRSGLDALSVIGARYSARLVSDLSRNKRISNIVLWDPVVDGKTWLDGLHTVQKNHFKKLDLPASFNPLELFGHIANQEFVDELRGQAQIVPSGNRVVAVMTGDETLPSALDNVVDEQVSVPYGCEWLAVSSEVLYSRELVNAICEVLE